MSLPGLDGTPPSIPKTSAYIGNAVSTANASTYTFSSQSIGAASPFRDVIVGVACGHSTGNPDLTVTSVTIGGVNAVFMGYTNSGGGLVAHVEFWRLRVPTGTTATIVVNTTAAADGMGIAVWTCEGYENFDRVDFQVFSDTSNVMSNTMDEKNGDLIFVIAYSHNSTVRTFTASGYTEDFDTTIEASSSSFTGGRKTVTADVTGATISTTLSGTSSKECMRAQAIF